MPLAFIIQLATPSSNGYPESEPAVSRIMNDFIAIT